MESILKSVKKMLGIFEDCNDFDVDLIIHINSVFMILNQLGVGTTKCFQIAGEGEVWSDFISDDTQSLVKSYMYLKVRLLFDPPLSSVIIEAIKHQLYEFEWRLNAAAESTARKIKNNE